MADCQDIPVDHQQPEQQLNNPEDESNLPAGPASGVAVEEDENRGGAEQGDNDNARRIMGDSNNANTESKRQNKEWVVHDGPGEQKEFIPLITMLILH